LTPSRPSHAIGRARLHGPSTGSCVGTRRKTDGIPWPPLAEKQKSHGPNTRALLLARCSALAVVGSDFCSAAMVVSEAPASLPEAT